MVRQCFGVSAAVRVGTVDRLVMRSDRVLAALVYRRQHSNERKIGHSEHSQLPVGVGCFGGRRDSRVQRPVRGEDNAVHRPYADFLKGAVLSDESVRELGHRTEAAIRFVRMQKSAVKSV